MGATCIRLGSSDRAAEPTDRKRLPAQWFPLLQVLLLTSFSTDALAYLDPGTGSILLQGLIAATAALLTFASLFWQRLKLFFRRLLGRSASEKRPNDEPPR